MGSLESNRIIRQFAQTFENNDYVHISRDALRVEYIAEELIRQYNKYSNRKDIIPLGTNNTAKLQKIKSLLANGINEELSDIKALIDLKIYYDANGIKQNEIIKKRKVVINEINKLVDTDEIQLYHNDILYNQNKVVFQDIENISQMRTFLDGKQFTAKKIYYRGQSDINWAIKPSIFRGNWIINEHKIIREMLIRSPSDFVDANSTLEKLTKMQHYNAPTRLLDLTTNPYIALYFACEQSDNTDDSYGEVILFNTEEENDKYFDSDTVSIISNIAMMKPDFSTKGLSKKKEIFNEEGDIPYLLHQIRYEKSNFLPIIEPDDLHKCVIVHVKLNNKRIINQQGLFLLVGMGDKKTISADIKNYCMIQKGKRIILLIKPSVKRNILNELNTMNINKGFIYPEIDGVADYVKNVVYQK